MASRSARGTFLNNESLVSLGQLHALRARDVLIREVAFHDPMTLIPSAHGNVDDEKDLQIMQNLGGCQDACDVLDDEKRRV